MSRRLEIRLSPSAEGATRGDLRTLALAELAQVIHLGGKTARVALLSRGDVGEIWFESGAAIHAECSHGKSGTPALYHMLGWKEGEFVVEYDVTTEKRSVEGDVMFHVFEGLKRLDEEGATVAATRPAGTDPPPRRRVRATPVLLGLLATLAGAIAIWSAASVPRARDSAATRPGVELAWNDGSPGGVTARDPAAKPSKAKTRPKAAKRETTKKQVVPPAEPIPAPAPVPEIEPPPGTAQDSSASTRDFTPGPAPPIVEAATAPPDGWLGLVVRSKLDAGTLSVVVDGETVHSATLKHTGGAVRRFFQKREVAGEGRFDARLRLHPGTHRLAARIRHEDGTEAQTAEAEIAIEPEATRELTIVAGGKRSKPIAFEIK